MRPARNSFQLCSRASARKRRLPYVDNSARDGDLRAAAARMLLLVQGRSCATATYAAGIGTVPSLIVYGLDEPGSANLHAQRECVSRFACSNTWLVPLIGTAIVLYGIYEYVQPRPASSEQHLLDIHSCIRDDILLWAQQLSWPATLKRSNV